MEFLVTGCLDVNNVLTRRVNWWKKSSRAVKHKDIKLLEVWEYVLKTCLVCPFLGISYAGIRGWQSSWTFGQLLCWRTTQSSVCLDHVVLQSTLLFQRTLLLSQAYCFFSFLICNHNSRQRQVAVCVLRRFLGLRDAQTRFPTEGRRIVSPSAVTRKQYSISRCFCLPLHCAHSHIILKSGQEKKTALMLMKVKTTSKQAIFSFELFNQLPELLSACPAEEGLGYTMLTARLYNSCLVTHCSEPLSISSEFSQH